MSLIHYFSKKSQVDDISNVMGYSAATIAAMVGLIAISFLPLPHQEKERQVREWVKRKDEEEDQESDESIKRRATRKAMREADKTKQARNRYREMKRAEYRAKWNKLWNQAQRDTIILTVNIQ